MRASDVKVIEEGVDTINVEKDRVEMSEKNVTLLKKRVMGKHVNLRQRK